MRARAAFEQMPHRVEEVYLLSQIPVASPRDTVSHALGSRCGEAPGDSEPLEDACRDRRAALAHTKSGNQFVQAQRLLAEQQIPIHPCSDGLHAHPYHQSSDCLNEAFGVGLEFCGALLCCAWH